MNAAQRREWREHVYGCPRLTLVHRLVLLALADFADWPDGTNARPGVERLAEICSIGERSVKEALRRGRDLKLIHQTARANPKRHLAAVYQVANQHVSTCTPVHVENVSRGTPVHVESDFKGQTTHFQGANQDVSRCTPVHPTKPLTPSPLTPSPLKERGEAPPPAPEQSQTLAVIDAEPATPPSKAKSPARRSNPRTPIPDDFAAPDSEIAKVLARFPNATRADIDRETYKFVNHHQSKGESRPNWLASWRNWMANADGYGNFTGTRHLSTSDKRVAEIQALKTHHQRELGA